MEMKTYSFQVAVVRRKSMHELKLSSKVNEIEVQKIIINTFLRKKKL